MRQRVGQEEGVSVVGSRRRLIIAILTWLGLWWMLVLWVTVLVLNGRESSEHVLTVQLMSSGDPKPIPPVPSPAPPGQPIPPAPDPPPTPKPIPPASPR